MNAHKGSQPRALLVAEAKRRPPEFPDWHKLSAALCGRCGDQPDDCLITRHAVAFATLHRTRHVHPDRADEIDCRRAELMTFTDNWMSNNVPGRRDSGRSLGAALDKIAAAQVAAEIAHRTVIVGGPNGRALEMWDRLGALFARWDLFVDHIVRGQPFLWPAESPRAEL